MDINKMMQDMGFSDIAKKKVEIIVDIYEKGTASQKEKEKAARLVDEVLEDLFKTRFSFAIPKEFMDTELGTLLFIVKYTNQYYYSSFDMEIIFDKTKSNLYYNRDSGLLNLINRGGQYIASEGEVKRFLASKGCSKEEIESRLLAFWEVKNEHHDKKIKKNEFKRKYEQKLLNIDNK